VIIERAASGKGTLVAMATHGRSGISRWFLGSIAEKVLRTIASAMLLVSCREEARYEPPGPLRFMLVPLDGSALAENVLPTAVELAKNLNLEILLARAYELPLGPYPGTDAFYVPQCNDLRAFVQEEARAYLEGKVNQVKSQGIEKASSAMLEGPAAEKIIELARATPDCLIAISTHGRSGIQRWVLGSVTEKVVRHCGRPVLVFPARAHESLAKPGTWWD
jgi:nucleotide-binding universal stress UspA family protein